MSSSLPENGVILGGGVEGDYLSFNSGMMATIGVAERKIHLSARGQGAGRTNNPGLE